jgi:hypothetical protein
MRVIKRRNITDGMREAINAYKILGLKSLMKA